MSQGKRNVFLLMIIEPHSIYNIFYLIFLFSFPSRILNLEIDNIRTCHMNNFQFFSLIFLFYIFLYSTDCMKRSLKDKRVAVAKERGNLFISVQTICTVLRVFLSFQPIFLNVFLSQ